MTEPTRPRRPAGTPAGEVGPPRWVKAFMVVGAGVVVVVLVLLLAGGDHGPGRHSGSGAAPPPVATTRPPTGWQVGQWL